MFKRFLYKYLVKERWLDHKQILSRLDEIFPPKQLSPKDTDRDIMFEAGKQAVVRFIKHKMENQ